jgi:hypothetical protein
MALEALLETGSAEFIFYAGAHWKKFDYTRGFEALLRSGEPEYLYKAGTLWREFDFERAWLFLERNVIDGERWRGQAFENEVWRRVLLDIWKKSRYGATGLRS